MECLISKKHSLKTEDYENLIRGKNVAIVGSAAYLEGYQYGKSIDEHDLIIRINRGCEVIEGKHEILGSRTDILYSCLIEQKENAGNWNKKMFVEDYGLKYLCTMPESSMKGISSGTRLHGMVDKQKYSRLSKELPCRIVDSDFFTSLALEVGCRPTTGYTAIYDILRFRPESLTIHGFDFFYSGWFSGYKNGTKKSANELWVDTLNSKRHKHKNMWGHCKRLLNNPAVNIDEHLQKVLSIDEWWFKK